jgi:hypothetical protein
VGWLLLWLGVVLVLAGIAFVPRRGRRRLSAGAPDGPNEQAIREAERFHGQTGGGGNLGAGGFGGGGSY